MIDILKCDTANNSMIFRRSNGQTVQMELDEFAYNVAHGIFGVKSESSVYRNKAVTDGYVHAVYRILSATQNGAELVQSICAKGLCKNAYFYIFGGDFFTMLAMMGKIPKISNDDDKYVEEAYNELLFMLWNYASPKDWGTILTRACIPIPIKEQILQDLKENFNRPSKKVTVRRITKRR